MKQNQKISISARAKKMAASLLALSLSLSPCSALAQRAQKEASLDLSKEISRQIARNVLSEQNTSSIGFHQKARLFSSRQRPESFDLRAADKEGDGTKENYVSSVKLQNPWGTCWAFGTVAAMEATLAWDLNLPADLEELDLSELQLAYFANKALPEEDNTGFNQGGEGLHFQAVDEKRKNREMDTGGLSSFVTSLVSSGIGPVYEEAIPYQGKEQLVENRAHQDILPDGTVVDKEGNIVENGDTEPFCYSSSDVWSVPEEDRFLTSFELSQSSILPDTVVNEIDSEGNLHPRYDEEAMNAWKDELLKGHAIATGLKADMARPGDDPDKFVYLNPETYAAYVDDAPEADHLVCIVGYDDNYSRDNFLENKKPPKDGAWIVKNSWGAQDSEFPNKSEWGLDGSGYFYVSYYDTSLSHMETFEFDTANTSWDNENYTIGQYDYLPDCYNQNLYFDGEVSMANVFEAQDNLLIHSLSTQSASANTTIRYDLYRLNENYQDPTDGQLVATISRSYPYAGYHREELDKDYAFKKGDKISVVISITRADGTSEICFDSFDSELSLNSARITDDISCPMPYGKSVINPGESFLIEYKGAEAIASDWKELLDASQAEGLQQMEENGYFEALENKDQDFLQAYNQNPSYNKDPLFVFDNFPIKFYAEYLEDELPFIDLGFGENEVPHWAALGGYIPEVFKKGLMKGKSEQSFAPNDQTRRAEVAATLYRLSGQDKADPEKYADGLTDFVDVNPLAWYAPAMKWAKENGVFTGSPVNQSLAARPDEPISRQELALVLFRYGNSLGMKASDNTERSYLDAPDADQVSSWAANAMEWAFDQGVLSGNGLDQTLKPKDGTKRGEYAKMLIEALEAFS